MSELSASCSCGAVRCEIAQKLETVVNCHCTMCRKMNGGAFSSMVVAPDAAVTFTAGEDALGTYALSEAVMKHFCRQCGSPMFNRNTRFPGFIMFFLGAVDGIDAVVPVFNVFCRSKLGWVDGIGAMMSYEASPDGGPS